MKVSLGSSAEDADSERSAERIPMGEDVVRRSLRGSARWEMTMTEMLAILYSPVHSCKNC